MFSVRGGRFTRREIILNNLYKDHTTCGLSNSKKTRNGIKPNWLQLTQYDYFYRKFSTLKITYTNLFGSSLNRPVISPRSSRSIWTETLNLPPFDIWGHMFLCAFSRHSDSAVLAVQRPLINTLWDFSNDFENSWHYCVAPPRYRKQDMVT